MTVVRELIAGDSCGSLHKDSDQVQLITNKPSFQLAIDKRFVNIF